MPEKSLNQILNLLEYLKVDFEAVRDLDNSTMV